MSQVKQDVRLTDPDSMRCPYENYAALHGRPVGAHHQPGAGGWAITGYDDLVAMSRDAGRYSNHWHGIDAGIDLMGQSALPLSDEAREMLDRYPVRMPNVLLLSDPPTHTRHRALVLKALNTRRVRETLPYIQTVINELIDGFIDEGRCEYMSQFAGPLPGTTSAHFLGMGREEVPTFFRWTEAFVDGFIEPIDNERRLQVGEAVIEYQTRMLELIAERRAEPRDDLLSDLVHAEVEVGETLDGMEVVGPRRLSDTEILSVMIILVTGGQHTTIGLLGNGIMLLLEHPELMAQLRTDPDRIPDFIEEALRIESPIQCTIRRAHRDMHALGADLPRDARLFAMWGAGNRDPRRFSDPARFDMDRPHNRQHLAFGHGLHFCVGAALARAQSRMAFETLLRRLEDIRLAPDDGAGGPAASLHPSMSARIYEHIHLEFSKA